MDVLCVGHAAWDISAFLSEYPIENSKCEIETLVECGGGPAANAAFLLSAWGASCALAASIGADAYGDRIVAEFADAGTDMALVRRDMSTPTPVSMILVNESTASRTIVNRRVTAGSNSLLKKGTGTSQQGVPVGIPFFRFGASPLFQQAVRPYGIEEPPSWPKSPNVLLFDGHELQASRDAMRHFPKAKTILDAGSVRPGTIELGRQVQFLVASERFACQLSGQPSLETESGQAAAMQSLWKLNGRPVVVTLGERGLLFGTGDDYRHLPAFEVEAVDTTAAGDIFHGAFAYGVLKEYGLEDTLRLASAAAALSVAGRGGRASIPELGRVQEYLADHV